MSRPRWWNAYRVLGIGTDTGEAYGQFHDGYCYALVSVDAERLRRFLEYGTDPGREFSADVRGFRGSLNTRLPEIPEELKPALRWNGEKKRYERTTEKGETYEL